MIMRCDWCRIMVGGDYYIHRCQLLNDRVQSNPIKSSNRSDEIGTVIVHVPWRYIEKMYTYL